MRNIADLTARVTFNRARSAIDPAWRGRPPSPSALLSSWVMKSISSRRRPLSSGLPQISAASIASCSSATLRPVRSPRLVIEELAQRRPRQPLERLRRLRVRPAARGPERHMDVPGRRGDGRAHELPCYPEPAGPSSRTRLSSILPPARTFRLHLKGPNRRRSGGGSGARVASAPRRVYPAAWLSASSI